MDTPVFALQGPETVVNEALDVLGQPSKILGSMNDGTDVAEAARRHYGQGVRILLRTAWWGFARKHAKLVLLGDRTKNSPPPVSEEVEFPWTYGYAWPTDAVQGRWMPWNPANAQPVTSTGIPLTTGVSAIAAYPMIPGRFLVGSTDLYPLETGVQQWGQLPDLRRTEGLGPVNRKVLWTDCCDAHFVYTRLVTVIEEWDALFRQAMVMMLALAIAPVAIDDVKTRIAMTDRLQKALKIAIDDARVANANEAGFPQSTDHQPIWITGRNQRWPNISPGPGGSILTGYTYYPLDGSMQWAGSVY